MNESNNIVNIRVRPNDNIFIGPEVYEVSQKLSESVEGNIQFIEFRASPPPGVFAMTGVELLVGSIALPTIGFFAKALRDVIVAYLAEKSKASIEIELPDGRKVKISGKDANSENVLQLLERISGNKV